MKVVLEKIENTSDILFSSGLQIESYTQATSPGRTIYVEHTSGNKPCIIEYIGDEIVNAWRAETVEDASVAAVQILEGTYDGDN